MSFFSIISRTSVRTLVTYIILGAMLPSFAVVLVLEWYLFTEKRSQTEILSANLARFAISRHQDAVHNGRAFLLAVSTLLHLDKPHGPSLSAAFTRMLHTHPDYAFLTLVTPDGSVIASSAAGASPLNPAGFTGTWEQVRFHVGQAVISPATGQPVLPFSLSLMDEQGAAVGFLMAGLRLDRFTNVFDGLEVPDRTRFLLVSQDGTRLLRYPASADAPVGGMLPDAVRRQIAASAPSPITFEAVDGQGLSVTYTFSPMQEADAAPLLGILVGIPTPSLAGQIQPVMLTTLAALGVITCIVFGVSFALSNRFYLRGMESLETQVAQVTEGRHLRPLDIPEGSREITSLGRAFNLMIRALAEDHAARSAAERKVRESETNFRNFFSAISDMIWVSSEQGRILYANTAMCATLGHSLQDLLHMQTMDLLPLDGRDHAQECFRAMLTGAPRVCQQPFLTRDGHRVPVETRTWLGTWDGKSCVFGISKNLTAEQEARLLFERLFHNNPVMQILTALPKHTFVDVNDSFLNVTGFSRQEVIGRTPYALDMFTDLSLVAGLENDLRSDGRLTDRELQIRRKDGSTLYGILSGEIITTQQGPFFLGVMIDITRRQQTEEQLRASEERLDLALFGTNAGLWDWDIRTDELVVNDRWMAMLGYQREELAPISVSTWERLCHPEDLARSDRAIRNHLDGSTEAYSCDVRLQHKDGHWIWVHDRGRCVAWSEDGQPLRMVGTQLDITQRRHDQELREEIERIVRHDLRSPAGNAVNIARLLADSPGLPPEDRVLARQLEISGQEMLDTLNLSLDLYKIESGQYVLSPEIVDVEKVLDEAMTPLRLVSAHGRREVRTQLPANRPARARGASFLLRMALRNLLQNALEASPRDGVVDVTIRDVGQCRIDIGNTGAVPVGIRHRFFEKYVTSGKSAGTGLGTYSARLMITAQHGTITMHTSDEANRTVLTLILPTA